MPRYSVAHVRERGTDLIIVPLQPSFGRKTLQQQQEDISELQARALAAGLAGIVVPVWDSGGGRMAFLAPQKWHPYFRSLDLPGVFANINRELFWCSE
jgi:hypothetical protein